MIQPSHFLVFNQRNWKCISITKIYSQVFTIALFMIAKLWKQRRCLLVQFSSVAQLCPTLRAHGLQHARLPCPSPTPEACSNSCPLSQWCHLILCHPLLLPSIFFSIRIFSNESVLHIRWSKYWSFSFSISPFNEYSGLISFKIDWLDLLAVQGTLKSLL